MSSYYNPYIAVPLAAWAVAQFMKFVIKAFRGDFDWRYLYASGGMPSVHSAAICALATTALAYEGFTSSIFGITAVFAAIVIYDSFGVRRSTGDQAIAINDILDNLDDQGRLERSRLREVLGHRPSEVITGSAVGVGMAFLLTINHWDPKFEFLSTAPNQLERLGYLIIFGSGFVLAVAIKLLFKRGQKLSREYKKAKWFVTTSLTTIGIAGLFTSLMQYQEVPNGQWRAWSLFVLGSAGVLYGLTWYYWLRLIPRTAAK